VSREAAEITLADLAEAAAWTVRASTVVTPFRLSPS
jgi:hypothetical protein